MAGKLKKKFKRKLGISVRQRLQEKQNPLFGSPKLMDRMVESSLDVLQNIESTLVSIYRDKDILDDCIVAEGLKCILKHDIPDDELTCEIYNALKEIRSFRCDVCDEDWFDCIRVVLQSVHRHSSLKSGEVSYLNFILDFA